MGRGKKRAQTRLSALAEGGPDSVSPSVAILPERQPRTVAAVASVPLSSAPRTQMLPESLKPRYAAAEPNSDVLGYARTHARNVARGEVKGAILLLRDNMRYLRRGFPALDTLLEAVVKRATIEADSSPECEAFRVQTYSLSHSHSVIVYDDPELAEAVRQTLVSALRQDGDAFAAAKATSLAERRERIAGQTARSVLSNSPEWLVKNWLQPLYLDRFLWKAYGRDYNAMPWPFAEQLQPIIAAALAEESVEGELRERILPQMVANFWPEVRNLVASELQNRTFSAKWDLQLERMTVIAEVR